MSFSNDQFGVCGAGDGGSGGALTIDEAAA